MTLYQYCTCDDPCSRNTDSVCNNTKVCTSLPTSCPRDNVALHKKATMSSRYIKSGDASLAVNGNTGTTFSGPGYTKSCKKGKRSKADVCVEPGKHRMENTRVTVDGQTCFNITDVRYLPEKINRSCHTKLTGRKVRLSGFLPVNSTFGNTLNLCELQVWVCKPGHYGDRCLYTCSSQCQGGQTKCDSNGDCTKGCDDTHYGPDCQEECGHCYGGKRCNASTGVCPTGCAPGYGPNQHCKTHKYGRDCRNTCSKGCVNNTCDQLTGVCSCRAGWNPQDAKCKTGCEAGTYGPSCQGKCSEGCAADCDDMSGHCDCKPGWRHSYKCEEKCEEGTYGHDCNMTCGHCAESSACERDTGRCTQGCVDGFEGDNCHEQLQEEDEGSAGVVAGVVIVVLLLLLILVVAVVLWYRRRGGCQSPARKPHATRGRDGDPLYVNCPEPAVYFESYDNDKTNERQPNTTQSNPMHGTAPVTGPSTVRTQPLGARPIRLSRMPYHTIANRKDDEFDDASDGTLDDDKWSEYQTLKLAIDPHQKHLLDRLTSGDLPTEFKVNDHSRVVLTKEGSDPFSDYINANYIKDYSGNNAYIATQGPLPNTVADFWRMVWQEHVTQIVMLTNLTEKMKPKCYQYWPEKGQQKKHGGITVTGVDVQLRADFFTRTFRLKTADRGGVEGPWWCGRAVVVWKDRGGVEGPWWCGRTVVVWKGRGGAEGPWWCARAVVVWKDRGGVEGPWWCARTVVVWKDRGGVQGPWWCARTVVVWKDRGGVQGPWWCGRTVVVWKGRGGVEGPWLCGRTVVVCKGRGGMEGPWWCGRAVVVCKGRGGVQGPWWCARAVVVCKGRGGVQGPWWCKMKDWGVGTGVQTVTQYQMTVWPDHGVPTAFSLVNLWRYIKTRTVPNTGPLLVHCSAGVGRTGTYIALDIAMDVLLQQRQNNVDIFSIASKLRQDRVIMIQAVDQYVFLHEALLEAYTSRDTRLQLDSFDVIFPQGVRTDKSDPRTDTEYKSLSQMKNFLSKPKYTTANKAENKGLNRTPSILPDDSHVVYLSVHVPGRNQYINAVSMPSFRQQTGMLLTQLPLSDTITDMWRLVEGFNVATIVSISAKEEEKKQDYCQYWPRTKESPMKCGPYTVKLTATDSLGASLTSYSLKLEKKSSRPYDVRVLHYNAWDDAVPEVTSALLHLLELLDTSHHDVTDRPFIVQCWDGATKSGLFCALYNVISRMTYDREVDVYLTARHVQSIRAEAISSQVQYRYCYHVVQEYKKAFDVYANS
ncbi:hypothetical protein BaRGS_00026826, partial [Batillaria attramentaria]